MRSAAAAVLLIALLISALGTRLWGSGDDPESLPAPPGLGIGHPALPSTTTLRATLLAPTCPNPISYAVIPAHDVSIDPSLVAVSVDRSRTIVVYSGLNIPAVFTAEIIDALYLARRLAQIVGLSRASFRSMFVTRFVVPLDCNEATVVYLAQIVDF